ncbi:hypothetical protein L7F22_016889 [Adiantum nelumboides]|nr:hypothetical protein [Adiantum nelumboides]
MGDCVDTTVESPWEFFMATTWRVCVDIGFDTPGLLPSSMLGLQSLTEELDEFGFEDFLNDPQSAESFVRVDMYLGMEVQLGLSKAPIACTFL